MTNTKFQKKPTEYIKVGKTDLSRRENLIANAKNGVGKAKQVGPDIHLVVGSDKFGYIEYTILNAQLTDESKKIN